VANESKHRHPDSDVRTSEEKVVELREEELEARKKIVETGKVRREEVRVDKEGDVRVDKRP